MKAERPAKCEGPEVRKLGCVRHSRGTNVDGADTGRGVHGRSES